MCKCIGTNICMYINTIRINYKGTLINVMINSPVIIYSSLMDIEQTNVDIYIIYIYLYTCR